MKTPTKKQRWIHPVILAGQIAAVLVAWPYLPPYLYHNPGLQILVGVFLASEAAHFILHDR